MYVYTYFVFITCIHKSSFFWQSDRINFRREPKKVVACAKSVWTSADLNSNFPGKMEFYWECWETNWKAICGHGSQFLNYSFLGAKRPLQITLSVRPSVSSVRLSAPWVPIAPRSNRHLNNCYIPPKLVFLFPDLISVLLSESSGSKCFPIPFIPQGVPALPLYSAECKVSLFQRKCTVFALFTFFIVFHNISAIYFDAAFIVCFLYSRFILWTLATDKSFY